MSTVTLKFSLPEESGALIDALKATEYRSAIEDLGQQLRTLTKHGDLPSEVCEKLLKFREESMEILAGHSILWW